MPTNEERRAAAKRKLDEQLQQQAKQNRQRKLAVVGGAIGAAVLVVAATTTVVLMREDDAEQAATAAGTTSTAPAPDVADTTRLPALPKFVAPAGLGTNCQYPASGAPASKEVKPPRTGKVPTDEATVSVSMDTDQGRIGLLLNNAQAPCSVNSFASLSNQGFFDDTLCHRLTTAPTLHVLQCGDPTGNGTGGPGYQFDNEYPTNQYPPGDPALNQPVIYPRGTIAMAHSGGQHNNGSQFFLVYQDSQLPPDYTVFGTIQKDGLETLDKIAAAGVTGGGLDGAPATKVQIKTVRTD